MSKQFPSYWGILTAPVRYDERLSNSAKVLFSEISALCNFHGFCSASNKYFCELYGREERQVQKWLKQLAEAGYIKIEITGGKHRRIYLFKEDQLGDFTPSPTDGVEAFHPVKKDGVSKVTPNNINNINIQTSDFLDGNPPSEVKRPSLFPESEKERRREAGEVPKEKDSPPKPPSRSAVTEAQLAGFYAEVCEHIGRARGKEVRKVTLSKKSKSNIRAVMRAFPLSQVKEGISNWWSWCKGTEFESLGNPSYFLSGGGEKLTFWLDKGPKSGEELSGRTPLSESRADRPMTADEVAEAERRRQARIARVREENRAIMEQVKSHKEER